VRFDASLSILFGDRPLLEQPAAAAALGFDSVETWWPFKDVVPAPADVDRLAEALGDAGVSLVSMNLAWGDRQRGQHGLVSLPDERLRFRDHLDAAAAVAGRLGVKVLNALYGNPPQEASRALVDDTAVDNLALAARRANEVGAVVVIEALNPVEFPRYGLHRLGESLAIADRVRAETGQEVSLMFDVYHVQLSEGDLLGKFAAVSGRIGHVQIADAPGRLRPGKGEIAFGRLLPAIEAAGYSGYVGLEYHPSSDPADTFSWLPVASRRSRRPAGEVDGNDGRP
jgi:hydroxypyruvate isomerase